MGDHTEPLAPRFPRSLSLNRWSDIAVGGWWPPHDSVEGFGLARAFSYVRFPSGPEGRVSREARAGDARTRCRPVSRGRLSAPVSPARDPVPAPLHRRKASREVHRRILTGRFARFGIRLHPNLQWGRLRVPSGCQVGCMKALEASSYRGGWRGDSGVPVTPACHGRKTALRSPKIAENRGKSPTAT